MMNRFGVVEGKDFTDYTSTEIARALKRVLGREDPYGVRWLFLDGDTILVRFVGEWIPVWFDQAEKYLVKNES